MANAKTSDQKSFALGWLCHVAASVTAEPFVNNIVGGPYRTHWWRNRLAQNFVDSWTYGFAETPATMAGDEPTPAYPQWASLCSANLQNAFNVGNLAGPPSADAVPPAVNAMATGNLGNLPQSFPAEITDLLTAALAATYPASSLPELGSLSAQTFADAYVGAYAVFWFLTSGEGPLGNNLLGNPPGSCGTTAPSWITSGGTPTPQQAGVNTAGAVCAALLAILAILSILGGDLLGGLAALDGALAVPLLDWDTIRCDLYWITSTLYAQENGLRDALVLAGLAYPPPVLLGGPDVNGNTQPATDLTPDPNLGQPSPIPDGNVAPSTGVPLTRSNALSTDDSGYPRARDTSVQKSADLDFASYPLTASLETPLARNLIPPDKYPDLVLNGLGLTNGGMTDDGVYPSRYESFGDAVSNALELIKEPGKIPNYNLDADRGYGWKGWHPQPGSDPTTLPVQDVED
jgi:hypothetical protein